jgi:hypothetical protein
MLQSTVTVNPAPATDVIAIAMYVGGGGSGSSTGFALRVPLARLQDHLPRSSVVRPGCAGRRRCGSRSRILAISGSDRWSLYLRVRERSVPTRDDASAPF